MCKIIQDLISVKGDCFFLNICSWAKKLQIMQFDINFVLSNCWILSKTGCCSEKKKVHAALLSRELFHIFFFILHSEQLLSTIKLLYYYG